MTDLSIPVVNNDWEPMVARIPNHYNEIAQHWVYTGTNICMDTEWVNLELSEMKSWWSKFSKLLMIQKIWSKEPGLANIDNDWGFSGK
jgi:hypothetical protein